MCIRDSCKHYKPGNEGSLQIDANNVGLNNHNSFRYNTKLFPAYAEPLNILFVSVNNIIIFFFEYFCYFQFFVTYPSNIP